jgi:hypothetical protein
LQRSRRKRLSGGEEPRNIDSLMGPDPRAESVITGE